MFDLKSLVPAAKRSQRIGSYFIVGLTAFLLLLWASLALPQILGGDLGFAPVFVTILIFVLTGAFLFMGFWPSLHYGVPHTLSVGPTGLTLFSETAAEHEYRWQDARSWLELVDTREVAKKIPSEGKPTPFKLLGLNVLRGPVWITEPAANAILSSAKAAGVTLESRSPSGRGFRRGTVVFVTNSRGFL